MVFVELFTWHFFKLAAIAVLMRLITCGIGLILSITSFNGKEGETAVSIERTVRERRERERERGREREREKERDLSV